MEVKASQECWRPLLSAGCGEGWLNNCFEEASEGTIGTPPIPSSHLLREVRMLHCRDRGDKSHPEVKYSKAPTMLAVVVSIRMAHIGSYIGMLSHRG